MMLHAVHHPAYVLPRAGGSAYQHDKYGFIIDALRAGGDLQLYEPEPMPRRWLEAVHDPAYVDEVIEARVPRHKERRIGFAITPAVARRAVLAPGGTWLAARLAIEHGYAANSAGGSHHALADTGAGYCVFNDLAVAVTRLLEEETVTRVLVIDLDVHQGDGTAALLGGRADVFTFSIHAAKNFPVRKARSSLDVALPDGTEDAAYLDALARHWPALLDAFRPGLVLYQAGVDVHADDRLGRLALSDAGIEARDRLVMAGAARRGIPLASTVGGGYGEDRAAVAARHVRTMRTLADEQAKHR